jgi:hypothetical protein
VTPDTLRADVEAIALPEGRMVGSPGHARSREHLQRRLAELGLAPYRGQSFALGYANERARVESYNLVAGVGQDGDDPRLRRRAGG